MKTFDVRALLLNCRLPVATVAGRPPFQDATSAQESTAPLAKNEFVVLRKMSLPVTPSPVTVTYWPADGAAPSFNVKLPSVSFTVSVLPETDQPVIVLRAKPPRSM